MSQTAYEDRSIAVILPCHDEAAVIARVVGDFRAALPTAVVYVIDNASSDATAEEAARAGAVVLHETAKGKGNAVRRAFADIEADVYLMADGDGTYDAARAPDLLSAMFEARVDMVVGIREAAGANAYRAGHRFGNAMFNTLIQRMFGRKFTDVFSGYRVFSRRFVKSFPALSQGFEIETELSVHAIHMGIPCLEIPTRYADRAEGTVSKLNTWTDGWRILMAMLRMMKHVRPLLLFWLVAGALAVLSLALGLPVVLYYLETHTVPRIPTTVAAAGLMILSGIAFVTGMILDNITYSSTVQRRLAYLSFPSPFRLDGRE